MGNTIQKLADTTSTPQKHTTELREDVGIPNLITGVCPVISLEGEEQVASVDRDFKVMCVQLKLHWCMS